MSKKYDRATQVAYFCNTLYYLSGNINSQHIVLWTILTIPKKVIILSTLLNDPRQHINSGETVARVKFMKDMIQGSLKISKQGLMTHSESICSSQQFLYILNGSQLPQAWPLLEYIMAQSAAKIDELKIQDLSLLICFCQYMDLYASHTLVSSC